MCSKWIKPGKPDPNGIQEKAIKEFLGSEEGKQFSYVWEDWWCMPQEIDGVKKPLRATRNDAEDDEFKTMLNSCHMCVNGI